MEKSIHDMTPEELRAEAVRRFYEGDAPPTDEQAEACIGLLVALERKRVNAIAPPVSLTADEEAKATWARQADRNGDPDPSTEP